VLFSLFCVIFVSFRFYLVCVFGLHLAKLKIYFWCDKRWLVPLCLQDYTSLSTGVTILWNTLSNHVVSADTVNTRKNRLDDFWSTPEVVYDYKADLHGIGNRSIIM